MELVEKIRARCIDANPNIVELLDEDEADYLDMEPYQEAERPIRLADVLLAISQTDLMHMKAAFGEVAAKWDLAADDLERQTPQELIFIAELLGI